MTNNPVNFDGAEYVPALDQKRLTKAVYKVFKLMKDGEWRTLAEISAGTGGPEASVSANLRDFRKERWGRYVVEKRRRTEGTWEYRLLPPVLKIGVNVQEYLFKKENE
jgi:hypothetical protein